MKEKKTQALVVLKHMREHGGITSMEAFERYGITRLSAIICDMRKQNKDFDVITEMKTTVNRYGNTVNYADYHLVERK